MNWQIKGTCEITFKDENDNIIHHSVRPNLITTNGLSVFAQILANSISQTFTHIAVGSSNTAPAVSDTALVSEIARKRILNIIRTGNFMILNVTFGKGEAPGVWRETGVFIDTVLIARTLTGYDYLKEQSKTGNITWAFQIIESGVTYP